LHRIKIPAQFDSPAFEIRSDPLCVGLLRHHRLPLLLQVL
jgi:hypothetical protein